MAFNRYFQDELDFLRRSGAEFAEHFPQLSSYLSEKNTDPDVDRILEGFAFLTARLREKIDDELPEVAQTLISLLWPNYLRPVPSMCMMRLTPIKKGKVTEKQIVKAGSMVSGGARGARCIYRICRDTEILPLTVTAATCDTTQKASIIQIDLSSLNGEPLDSIGMDKLRFHFGNSDFSALHLNLWIHRYLGAAYIEYGEPEENEFQSKRRVIEKHNIISGGLEADEAVIPYPNNAFPGYRLLQEYYAFPQKFYFVTFDDLPKPPGDVAQMRLVLEFTRPLPPDARVEPDAFQLHCVPAINLFDHDAEPLLIDGRRVSYPVRPAGRDAVDYEIFSIEKVTGWRAKGLDDAGSGLSRTYHRFESFQHEMERATAREAVYYRESLRQRITGEGLDRQISFVAEDESISAKSRETVSVELLCTNGHAPLGLQVGSLTTPEANMASFVKPTNIGKPTAPLYPIVDGSLQWMLISCLSLNYLSLLNKDAIRTILFAYDFGARVDRQREREAIARLDGILDIETKTTDRLFKGLPVRGMQSTITMKESRYGSEGEMYLFASVLAEFFALYSTINSFHHLKVIGAEMGERYEWTPKIGRQPLL